jgi:hypothetical protein
MLAVREAGPTVAGGGQRPRQLHPAGRLLASPVGIPISTNHTKAGGAAPD